MMTAPTCSKLYISGIYLTPTPPREKKYAGGVIFWRSSSRQTANKSNRSESERVKANSLHRGYSGNYGDIPGQHDNQPRQPEKNDSPFRRGWGCKTSKSLNRFSDVHHTKQTQRHEKGGLIGGFLKKTQIILHIFHIIINLVRCMQGTPLIPRTFSSCCITFRAVPLSCCFYCPYAISPDMPYVQQKVVIGRL